MRRHRQWIDREPEASAIILAVGPLTARPAMMGETAMTGAAAAASGGAQTGSARIGCCC